MSTAGANETKIAKCSEAPHRQLWHTWQGRQLSSLVDPRFWRAKYFMVVDTETGEFAAADNSQNLNAVQGAGIQAGKLKQSSAADVEGHWL